MINTLKETTEEKELTISVCGDSSKKVAIAVFENDFHRVRDFKYYEPSMEQVGIDEAVFFVQKLTNKPAKFVYPKITKMRMS